MYTNLFGFEFDRRAKQYGFWLLTYCASDGKAPVGLLDIYWNGRWNIALGWCWIIGGDF